MIKWIRNFFGIKVNLTKQEPNPCIQELTSIKEQVKDLLHQHHKKALNSPYDHKISIEAMGAAQSTVERVDVTLPDTAYLTQLEEDLIHCRDTYNNTRGEYTSGKGEIGSFLCDIQELRMALDDEM